MKIALDRPNATEPRFTQSNLRSPVLGRAPVGSALHTVLVTLLAWVALLCAGLFGSTGLVTHTLAAKLASTVQHLQRHGGPSLTSRAVRRELPVAQAQLKVGESSPTVSELRGDSLAPSAWNTSPAFDGHFTFRALAPAIPHSDTRHRRPLSRAPPFLA